MSKTSISVYKAKDGLRWRMKRAGRIVADSGQGYSRYKSLERSLLRLIDSFKKEQYVVSYK